MNLCSVRLRNFRNHADSRLDFGTGVNALVGKNGQGKTNILESISYLSLTKSFFAAGDETVLQIGKDMFEVEGTIRTASGSDHIIRCIYTGNTRGKVVTINGSAPESFGSVIGRFPVVILSPEHGAITSGGPSERRKFLDLLLSQVSRAYFDDLLEYRRVLKQRNRILTDARSTGVQRRDILEPWDMGIIRYGSSVTHRRCVFLQEIERYVKNAYAELVSGGEDPTLQYASEVVMPEKGVEPETIAALLQKSIERLRNDEFRRGVSLAGPHRDDVRLLLSGRPVKEYASQGQHKTFLVALKLAEFSYLRERKLEAPLFLLDDVFSELDAERVQRILALVGGWGQTILTTTDEEIFHGALRWNDSSRRFYVENGTCRQG